ncbi:hypothetical protein M3Y94_00118300 [Aphelenchoides besseyi]|nr:hypothetical protein M3Y94_00118300 [Aphelenchoides besseyi]KAI6237443.1 hypothetical protein M3Y95_00265600 [Aphelenchoides besseyi]
MADDHQDQSRVVMKFEEKRQLLQAILDRKDQLFGAVAAKMKPAIKQSLWEEVISTFRRHCPESTAELSAGYVRGIFWQNLRKRTLAKRERAQTDENVKFDELDELVSAILGDSIITASPLTSRPQSNGQSNSYSNISDLFPFLQDTNFLSQLSNGTNGQIDNTLGLSGIRFALGGNESPQQSNHSADDWKDNERPPLILPQNKENDRNLSGPPAKKRKYSQIGMARLVQVEAQTARIRAETRLLDLKFACECKRQGLKAEVLPDGRKAFIITDPTTEEPLNSVGGENSTGTNDLTDEEEVEMA